MKNLKLFSSLALFACVATVNAQSVVGVAVSKNATGTRVYADITLAGDGAITALALDLIYPSDLTYNKSAISSQGLCQVYDEDENVYDDSWTIDDLDYADYRFVRLVTKGKTNVQIPANSTGKMFRITFVSSDPEAVYTADDFCFNNANASLGTAREEMKFPIGKLGANGYSSYSSSQDIIIEGATAYYGTLDAEVLKLTAVEEGQAICHNKGVVLQGTEGATVYGISVDEAPEPASSDLTATLNGTTVTANSVHVLATVAGETGFYTYTGTKIGAGKAYLEGASGARISFDEETGIDNLNAETELNAIYNLQGQKLLESKRGINIVNGKKVMY